MKKVKEEDIKDDNKEEETAIMPWSSIVNIINTEILPELADEDGWASLADVGNRLYKLYSDFDSRNYGYKKLSELFKSDKNFETKPSKPNPDSNLVYYLIRAK